LSGEINESHPFCVRRLLGVTAFIRDEKSVDIIRVIANEILAAEIEGELTDYGGELAPNNSRRTG